MKKAPTASLHVITLVTADWYGSDSSWPISQIKIIETIMFSAKLRGPNKALGDCEFLFFFLGKLFNVDVYFHLCNQEDKEGSRKGSPQVHLFQSYARPKSSHKIAFDFVKFSEASEQQGIKHSQRWKLFITIQFKP